MATPQTELGEYTRPGGTVPSKSDVRAALACWRGYVQGDPDVVFEVHLALGANVWGRSFHQARAHPNGRRVFQQKPDILQKLRDDEYLATLPPGTVGHAYRAFLTINRLDAGIYDEVSIVRPLAEKNNWDEEYYYFIKRVTAIHDLVHVITGYGPDLAGEVIAIGFTCGQMEPASPLRQIGYAMAAGVPGARVLHKLRVYRQAVERGRRADKLAVAPRQRDRQPAGQSGGSAQFVPRAPTDLQRHSVALQDGGHGEHCRGVRESVPHAFSRTDIEGDVGISVDLVVQESRGPELLGVGPEPWVTVQAVRRDQDIGARGYEVPTDLVILDRGSDIGRSGRLYSLTFVEAAS